MQIKATIKQLKGDYSMGGLRLDAGPEPTDFSLGGFGGVKIGKAPHKNFRVPNVPETFDQLDTDFCTAHEAAYTLQQDVDKKQSPPFLFAAAKKRYYGGDYSGFGLRLKDPLGVLQHDGACRYNLYPYKGRHKRNWMANWKNIPQTAWKDAAGKKMKKGYFLVDIYKDKYENFAAAMWNWREMIITGIRWYQGFYINADQRLILSKRGKSVGHAISAIEQKIVQGERWMKFKNSYLDIPEFWLTEDEVRREMYYGYIVLPFERPIIEIIQKYAGRAVMSDVKDKKDVYLVINGQKRLLPNEFAAWAWNILLWEDVVKIPDTELTSIPGGDKLTPAEGDNFKIMKEIFSLDISRFTELKKYIT